MKKALVCPNEPVTNGYRIAQVELPENVFPMAEPLYWMDCDNEVVADQWYFDTNENIIKQSLLYYTSVGSVGNQPISTGAQTL